MSPSREFSDCAVGVLDRAFNEDSMRTFEMLDEKHPVSTERRRLEINLDRRRHECRIGITWRRSNWRTMPRIKNSWLMRRVKSGSHGNSMARSHLENCPGVSSNVQII